MNTNCEKVKKILETKCGCVIRRDSKEHDECRCDEDGENWICAGCYSGEYDEDSETTLVSGIICNKCQNVLPTMTMAEHLDINNPLNICQTCELAKFNSGEKEESKSKIVITPENLYDYFVIEEWDKSDDGTDGFSYTQSYDIIGGNDEDEGFEELHEKMFDEIRLNYESFNAERSCMWVEEVKRRAKWVTGETLYGYSREKHYTYPIWWSRDKKNIGHFTWILEADGYVSFSFANGYTRDETEHTKYGNYIRPSCLYNDKVCDELSLDYS